MFWHAEEAGRGDKEGGHFGDKVVLNVLIRSVFFIVCPTSCAGSWAMAASLLDCFLP